MATDDDAQFWCNVLGFAVIGVFVLTLLLHTLHDTIYNRGYSKGLDDGRRGVWVEATIFGFAKEEKTSWCGYEWRNLDDKRIDAIDDAIEILKEERARVAERCQGQESPQ